MNETAREVGTPEPQGTLPSFADVSAVALGGAVGTLARAAISTAFPVRAGEVPWSTLVENLSGALLLGFVLTALVERVSASRRWRLLLGTGALGAYTTFSAVSVELHALVSTGHPALALAYAVGSLIAGVAAAALGMWAARRLLGRAA